MGGCLELSPSSGVSRISGLFLLSRLARVQAVFLYQGEEVAVFRFGITFALGP
jgi:hypothetical protein